MITRWKIRASIVSAIIVGGLMLCAPANAIIGGVLDNQYANYSVMVVSKGGTFCSGVVISTDIVITAAQCIKESINNTKIHWRDHNNKPIFAEIENIVIHPEYVEDAIEKRTRSIDLAIIKTKQGILKSFNVITLPDKNFQIFKAGTFLELTGFGVSSETDNQTIGKLRVAKLPIVTPFGQGKLLVWLEGNNSGACSGDSGGGIIGPNNLLIGITVWSEGTLPKRCGKLTQGIMLAPIRDWIDNTINVLAPKLAPPQILTPPVTVAPPPSSGSQAISGTAFRVSNGQFVTNHHVIEGCTTLKVGGFQGGRVLASDTINDLALISVPNDIGDIASIRTTRTQLNEAVTAAGFPLQIVFSGIAITNGTVSRLSGLKGDTGQVQISAPVQPGNSGGPLLDSAGNVIGVVSSKLNAVKIAAATGDIPQNINFAIGGNTLRTFLDAKGVNYKEVGREADLRGEQIAQRASGFTVLVECR